MHFDDGSGQVCKLFNSIQELKCEIYYISKYTENIYYYVNKIIIVVLYVDAIIGKNRKQKTEILDNHNQKFWNN